MKIAAVIQTRMGSTRYPGKVLEELDGKYKILDHVINQLGFCKLIGNIIIATTTLKEDDVIVEYAKDNNLDYFRGKPLDVLDRYYQCAKKFSLEIIIRVTSDCPFLDPTIIDKIVEKFHKSDFDFVCNNIIRTYPIGVDAEVFSFKTLEKTWKNAKLPSEREHVTPFMKKNDEGFKIHNIDNVEKIPIYRLSIDRKDDLKFLQEIKKNIHHEPILMKDVYNLFKIKPEILNLYNDKMDVVEGYKKSLKEDEEFLKKMNPKDREKYSDGFKETVN